MFAIDTIVVVLIILAALAYLGRHYLKKWKSPKACGSGACGCSQTKSKVFSKDKSL